MDGPGGGGRVQQGDVDGAQDDPLRVDPGDVEGAVAAGTQRVPVPSTIRLTTAHRKKLKHIRLDGEDSGGEKEVAANKGVQGPGGASGTADPSDLLARFAELQARLAAIEKKAQQNTPVALDKAPSRSLVVQLLDAELTTAVCVLLIGVAIVVVGLHS